LTGISLDVVRIAVEEAGMIDQDYGPKKQTVGLPISLTVGTWRRILLLMEAPNGAQPKEHTAGPNQAATPTRRVVQDESDKGQQEGKEE
jgi:hypothetical protein